MVNSIERCSEDNSVRDMIWNIVNTPGDTNVDYVLSMGVLVIYGDSVDLLQL